MQELWELEIAKRYLMCPYFEIRIKGMKEFKLSQIKIMNTAVYNSVDLKKQNIESSNYLTCALFSEWVLKNKILEYIYNENTHSEIIKRSKPILDMMV